MPIAPGAQPSSQSPTKCELVKIACDRPPKSTFTSVWTQQALSDELRRQTGRRVSRSTVQRVLSAEGLRPHRVRQWLHSPDPKFREKVARVCELYLHPPPKSVVVCIDEKPMQALTRKHPSTRAPDGSVKREFEYVRHGTCSLLASFDVATGELLGKVVKRRTAAALVGFLDDVAARYPNTQVYVVWDNLNIHKEGKTKRWSTFNLRHWAALPLRLHAAPRVLGQPGRNLVLDSAASSAAPRLFHRLRRTQARRPRLHREVESHRRPSVSVDLQRSL